MNEPPKLTTDNIDAVLRFLPIFEADGFTFGEWMPFEGGLPAFSFSDEAGQFIDALYHNNWVIPFDWGEWQDEARRITESPEHLNHANLETLRKLLTLHVRTERFCEGHLCSMFESGNLTAILSRLRAIRQSLP